MATKVIKNDAARTLRQILLNSAAAPHRAVVKDLYSRVKVTREAQNVVAEYKEAFEVLTASCLLLDIPIPKDLDIFPKAGRKKANADDDDDAQDDDAPKDDANMPPGDDDDDDAPGAPDDDAPGDPDLGEALVGAPQANNGRRAARAR